MMRSEVERDELDGGYVATFPAMPGAVSQGKTPEEALRKLRDAVRCVLDSQPDADADPQVCAFWGLAETKRRRALFDVIARAVTRDLA